MELLRKFKNFEGKRRKMEIFSRKLKELHSKKKSAISHETVPLK
jgi:hypothetical protein